MRHLLTFADLTRRDVEQVLAIAKDLKSKYENGVRESILPGRVMALLFEKPSLRTRVSFEAGMTHLGGSSLFLGADVGWGERETVADFGAVLSQYVDVVVMRAGRHQAVVDLAAHCTCSVINGLTDYAHPCQAISDLFTLGELVGSLDGATVAYVGDANNVARSLAQGCAMLGARFAIASPKGYQFAPDFVAEILRAEPGAEVVETTDPREAVRGAMAVYTDVWASMGQESEAEKRRRVFASYQVNAELMSHAEPDAFFMHCLPAHRGDEVTSEVIDGPNSIVVRQAGNRMHAQKGLLAWLLGAHP